MGTKHIAQQRAKVSNGMEVPFQLSTSPPTSGVGGSYAGKAAVGSTLTDSAGKHLAAVRRAASKLRRAEQARDKAQAELVAAIRDAEATKLYRVDAIVKASGMPRASFYRLKGSQDG